ncbi:MAG TPA: membrane protein insertion efficiency factor YidD [Deltaproteobacteria bacterium]|nr:membrane protein insertion efficiency factor YidD [Deltaproteobacteria bacterium]
MVKSGLILLIRLYKALVSPVLPPSCRFHPSCADYAAEAVEVHGVLRGARLAAVRVCRCHPWNAGGYDPVPPAGGAAGRGRAARPPARLFRERFGNNGQR